MVANKINWNRGFLRLWIVVSLLWIIAWSVYIWAVTNDYFILKEISEVKPGIPSIAESTVALMNSRLQQIQQGVFYATIPPAILLMLGLVVKWISKGFASNSPMP